MRRLRGRMNATGNRSVADYALFVERDPDEYERLLSSLLIKVTEFFRDQGLGSPSATRSCRASSTMRCVRAATSGSGPPAARPARRPTHWRSPSPRSSTADLASTSASSRPTSTPRPSHSRVAASIRQAPEGHPGVAAQPILHADGDRFEVVKSLRSQMVFGEHDLSTRVPFPRMDLLLCRNVLIYFTPPLQRVALETFAYSLRPGGRLVRAV